MPAQENELDSQQAALHEGQQTASHRTRAQGHDCQVDWDAGREKKNFFSTHACRARILTFRFTDRPTRVYDRSQIVSGGETLGFKFSNICL